MQPLHTTGSPALLWGSSVMPRVLPWWTALGCCHALIFSSCMKYSVIWYVILKVLLRRVEIFLSDSSSKTLLIIYEYNKNKNYRHIFNSK